MKKIIVSFIALLFTLSAYAQTQVGPVAGVNMAMFRYSESVDHNSYRIGYSLGIKSSTNFGKIFAFQPALIWNNIGGKQKDGDNSNTNSINYLALPLNLAIRLGDEDGGQFQVFLGPYVGYALSGKEKTKLGDNENTSEIKFGSDSDKTKPGDYGLNIGIGYKTGGALFNLGYGLGLANLSNSSGAGSTKAYNSVVSLNVAFLFGKSGSE